MPTAAFHWARIPSEKTSPFSSAGGTLFKSPVESCLVAVVPVPRSRTSAINAYLVRWIRNKYRRLDRTRAAHAKLAELAASQPRLFRHWAWVTSAWR